nr:hypothetical protein [Tanacetum cinerariifolium]
MEVLLAWPLRMPAVMPRLLSVAPQGVMKFEFLEASLLGSSTLPSHNTAADELAERAVTVCNYTLLCSNLEVQ